MLELGASEGSDLFSRTLNIGPRRADLVVQVAHQKGGQAWTDGEAAGFREPRPDDPGQGERSGPTAATLVGAPDGVRWVEVEGDPDDLRLRVPAGDEPIRFKVVIGRRGRSNAGFLARPPAWPPRPTWRR